MSFVHKISNSCNFYELCLIFLSKATKLYMFAINLGKFTASYLYPKRLERNPANCTVVSLWGFCARFCSRVIFCFSIPKRHSGDILDSP